MYVRSCHFPALNPLKVSHLSYSESLSPYWGLHGPIYCLAITFFHPLWASPLVILLQLHKLPCSCSNMASTVPSQRLYLQFPLPRWMSCSLTSLRLPSWWSLACPDDLEFQAFGLTPLFSFLALSPSCHTVHFTCLSCLFSVSLSKWKQGFLSVFFIVLSPELRGQCLKQRKSSTNIIVQG